jgi:hypothetical protein
MTLEDIFMKITSGDISTVAENSESKASLSDFEISFDNGNSDGEKKETEEKPEAEEKKEEASENKKTKKSKKGGDK